MFALRRLSRGNGRSLKRVLLTVHKFFPKHKAGTEVLTLKIAQELQGRGYEVLVVTANPPDLDARHAGGPFTSDYEYEGIRVHVIEEALRLKGYTFKHEYYHAEIQEHFAQLLDVYQPDLLHIVHAQNLSGSIIDVARQHHVPVVCSATDFWFVCPIVQLKRPDGAVCRGPDKFAGNCLTCYTPRLLAPVAEFEEAITSKYRRLGSILGQAPPAVRTLAVGSLYASYSLTKLPGAIAATTNRPGVLRRLANSVSAIMVPTKLMRDIFIENGIREELLHHVPFGLDTSALVAFTSKLPCDNLRIGYIGTLFEHKGVDLLVRAFQALPADAKAQLSIYGDLQQFPEYGRQLVELARTDSPHSNRITFGGTFPNSELGSVLSGIDVLVVPSRWYENTPLVIQSALATKTPVIATNLGGMSELIKQDVNGLLFTLNDWKSLRDQLERLLPKKNGLLARLRENIAEQRSIATMVDDIERVYDLTCAGRTIRREALDAV